MPREWLFQIGIKALITNEKGEILVLKASEGAQRRIGHEFWDLPGGRMQKSAGIAETLRREIEEELGINRSSVLVGELLDAGISGLPPISHNFSLMLLIYRCDIPAGIGLKLSDENPEYRWVRPEEAKELLKTKFPPSLIAKLDQL
jgi:8-oxo-dGTP pyrophosphatase MutT (NUDIX family)